MAPRPDVPLQAREPRVKSALDVHHELLARDVPHEMVRLRASVLAADDLPRALDLEPVRCVAVRCYVADDRFTAVLVPAGAVPDPAALLAATGARALRPATDTEVNAATDFAARLVSPVGLPEDVPVLADDAFGGEHVLYAPVGEGGVVLGIRPADLLRVGRARSVPLTRRADPAGPPPVDLTRVLDLDAASRPAPLAPRGG